MKYRKVTDYINKQYVKMLDGKINKNEYNTRLNMINNIYLNSCHCKVIKVSHNQYEYCLQCGNRCHM